MAGTVLRLGWTDPRSDAFGAHPLLGDVLDLNDGVTFTLLDGSLELEPPAREVALSGNPRTQGERATRALYRRNRQARAQLCLGPMASASDLIANIRSLVRWLDAPPAVPLAIQWQPPSATSPVYLDVVGAAHGIPADEREWLRLQVEPVEVVFLVRPGLRGDRVTLSNLAVNPGFEQGSGPGVTVFSDTFATFNAYTVQAGAALTQDTSTYADAVGADAPLRYYRLDEASGTVVYDAGSTATNGATHGAPTQGVAGLLSGDSDTCYTFASASTQYVSSGGTGLPTGNAVLTLEALVKIAANPAASAGIVSFGNSAGTGSQIVQVYLGTGGNVVVDFGGPTGRLSSAALTLNTPHHIAVTFDGTTLILYVDGVSAGSSTPGALAVPASPVFNVGALPGGGNTFNGQIDEAVMYGSALSGTRVAAHHTAAITAPTAAVNTALLASGNRVSFGSSSWGALNQWQMRLRYFAGAA